MSNETPEDRDRVEVSITSQSTPGAGISSTYKVLGEDALANGAGVLGNNTAGSGTPIGVEGAVPNASTGYGLSTPDDARVGGTAELGGLAGSLTGGTDVTDLVGPGLSVDSGTLGLPPGGSDGDVLSWDGSSWTTGAPGTRGSTATFELLAGGDTALRLEPTTAGDPNVIGGDSSNQVSSDSSGAFVGGGEQNSGNGDWTTIGGGIDNTTSGARTTIVGGKANTAARGNAFVGGGKNNTADAPAAALVGGTSNAVTGWYGGVGGGIGNTASGKGSAVPGGKNNTADGNYSFAGGQAADTNGYDGTFVWGGSGSTPTTASDAAQVVFNATGGFIVEGNATVQGRTEISTLGGSLTGGTDVTDIAGSGLTISSGALTVSESKPSVSDDGTQVLSAPQDLDFGSNLAVTDDGDDTVTIDTAGLGLDVEDDGSAVLSNATALNFGTGLTAADNGDGTATVYVPDTLTDVADDGTRVVTDVEEIDFASNLSVSADGDGSVTVDGSTTSSWNDGDGDSLLEPNSGFEGVDLTDATSGRVLTTRIDTAGSDFQLSATGSTDARNVIMGHGENDATSDTVGGTISGGGYVDGNTDNSHAVRSSYGTIAGGMGNAVKSDAVYSTVAGGRANHTSDWYATTGGGKGNTASGRGATVGGGESNTASGRHATVGGGTANEARSQGATIAGGGNSFSTAPRNVVHDDFGTIAGGDGNQAGTDDASDSGAGHATVGGGQINTASGQGATVAGGRSNTATSGSGYATVSGGTSNVVKSEYATVGGGDQNTGGGSWSTVGGGSDNTASGASAAVGGGSDNTASRAHAAVAGGYNNTASAEKAIVGGGDFNRVTDKYGTIGGGGNNQAGDDQSATTSATYATVGGGEANVASDDHTTVGGGAANRATGTGGTVPGGFGNKATSFAFAAGTKAEADAIGSYVWADTASSSGNVLTASATSGPGPTGFNTFHARCTGGARFITDVDNSGIPTHGVKLASGGGSWNSLSSRAAKTDVQPVDPSSVLDALREIEVTTWRYVSQTGTRHIGPMAEAFHDAFGVGEDRESINTVDADGVALAAIQGLAGKYDDLSAENEQLRERLADKDDRIANLEAETAELRDRLAALETQVGADPTPEDD
jgi:hypothetical protein